MSIETQPSSWAGNPVPGRPSGDRILSPPDTLLRTIADRWGLVLGGMFACALLASVVSLRAPTLYEAHATIVVSSPSDDPNLQAQAVTNARTILENRTNANTVIKQVGLDQAPDLLDPGTLVSRRLMVQQVRDTNYLTVTLRASSPSKAENALKALLQGGIGLSNHLGDADRNPASAWMHEQLLSAREALDRAGDKLIAFEKQEELAQLHKEPARTADKSEQKIDADLARRWERSKLELDVLLATRAYADVAARLDKSKASAASRNVSISIADEPLAGQSQVSPRVWLSAAVGATLGLLGMALALTAFWSGRSVLSGSSPEP